MRTVRRIAAAAPLLLAVLSVPLAAMAEGMPKVGDRAPDFTLAGSDGKSYALSDFVGEREVVLAWFPKAFTPGCTVELTKLHESADRLEDFEAAVFMVSLDDPERNGAFAASHGASQTLLSDRDGRAAQAFGVAGPGGSYAKRWTFYIDREGVIRHIDTNVDVATAGADIARTLGDLGFARKSAPAS